MSRACCISKCRTKSAQWKRCLWIDRLKGKKNTAIKMLLCFWFGFCSLFNFKNWICLLKTLKVWSDRRVIQGLWRGMDLYKGQVSLTYRYPDCRDIGGCGETSPPFLQGIGELVQSTEVCPGYGNNGQEKEKVVEGSFGSSHPPTESPPSQIPQAWFCTTS